MAVARPGADQETCSDESERRQDRTQSMLRRLADTTNDHERERLSDEIVLLNMPVAQSIARRYRNRGVDLDDLEQVAHLGLVNAVDRYDADSGNHFLAFAVPTITGEIRRHFRDHSWAIRPTRRIQNAKQAITTCLPEMTQVLGRSPRPTELAEHLGLDEGDVQEALATENFFNLVSLDTPTSWEDARQSVADTVGDDDPQLDQVEDRELLAPALARLTRQEQQLLTLRFEKGWNQARIGAEFGVSQMQVSRQLSALLKRLREHIAPGEDGPQQAWPPRRDPPDAAVPA